MQLLLSQLGKITLSRISVPLSADFPSCIAPVSLLFASFNTPPSTFIYIDTVSSTMGSRYSAQKFQQSSVGTFCIQSMAPMCNEVEHRLILLDRATALDIR